MQMLWTHKVVPLGYLERVNGEAPGRVRGNKSGLMWANQGRLYKRESIWARESRVSPQTTFTCYDHPCLTWVSHPLGEASGRLNGKREAWGMPSVCMLFLPDWLTQERPHNQNVSDMSDHSLELRTLKERHNAESGPWTVCGPIRHCWRLKKCSSFMLDGISRV